MKKDDTIFVAGARGMVGGAIVQRLKADGYTHVLAPLRSELNLCDQAATNLYFQKNKIDYVFMAAARVGGILANQEQQADFLYENLMIATNVIHAAAKNEVTKLLFLGSSCIYPKNAPQPITENALLTSALEPSNEGYAIAKIAGLKLCEKYFKQYGKHFISAMPTNLYGPGDNFHPTQSHVIPGMMRKFHEAKMSNASEVRIWGTGTPKREFLHVEDLVSALVVLMQKYDSPETVNVGYGDDLSILELANLMKKVTGFQGRIVTDPSKPDGTPRKLLNSQRMASLGWAPLIKLEQGLASSYEWALRTGALGDLHKKAA